MRPKMSRHLGAHYYKNIIFVTEVALKNNCHITMLLAIMFDKSRLFICMVSEK